MPKIVRVLLMFMAASFATMASAQQWDPRAVMAGVIQQFQTGTPNGMWYSPQLWQLMAYQTNNTGFSPALASLGPVQDIQITDQIQLPAGPVYSLNVRHANAQYTAQIGISYWTNRIEYLTLNFQQATQPTPQPLPPSPMPPNPNPQPQPQSTTPDVADSEACRRFPNLC
jgi:hypothetical protein